MQSTAPKSVADCSMACGAIPSRIGRTVALVFAMFLASAGVQAQAPDTLWVRTFGGTDDDLGYTVEVTSDGGFIVAGESNSVRGGISDVWLIRTDADGHIVWTRNYGGTLFDGAFEAKQTTDGGYIATGHFGRGPTDPDLYLLRMDANGDTLWTRTFGGLLRRDIGYGVDETSDGGFVVTGEIQVGGFSEQLWLLKTNANGVQQWSKSFGEGGRERGFSVQQTTDGGYIVAGETASRGVTGVGDVWLVKTDASGDTLWTRNYGGPGFDAGNEVHQTPDGGYIVAGIYTAETGGSDVWLLKTDAAGDTLWTRRFDGGGQDEGESVTRTVDGGYVLSSFRGLVDDDLWLIRTDANGDTLWTASMGGSGNDQGNSVRQTPDGGYVVAGYTTSRGAGANDVLLVKFKGGGAATATESDYPEAVRWLRHYPNPTGSRATISFQTSQVAHVDLALYDVLGRRIQQLARGIRLAGTYEVSLDVTGLPPGVYFYRLEADDYVETKGMVVIRSH